jgi:hypothetical protein
MSRGSSRSGYKTQTQTQTGTTMPTFFNSITAITLMFALFYTFKMVTILIQIHTTNHTSRTSIDYKDLWCPSSLWAIFYLLIHWS